MNKNNVITLEQFLEEDNLLFWQKVEFILKLSIPGILAELTSIAMQYIDAAMVGRLGANATGAIGLVSTSTWLLGGSCISLATGFYVQVAHLVGAGENEKASNVFRQGLTVMIAVGFIISTLGILISDTLPIWLGGDLEIVASASAYFRIYSYTIPCQLVRYLSGGMLQASGDLKRPSQLSAILCLLDVLFNLFFIFPSRVIRVGEVSIPILGAGLDVTGAALGTAIAEVVVTVLMFIVAIKNPKIGFHHHGNWKFNKKSILNAVKIAIPMMFDHIFMCGAYVAGTKIISPLGTAAVAANSLAVTAESLCYMPGYGVGSAATAIIGQSIGAKRKDLTKSFSRLSVVLGMVLMGVMGFIMYIGAPLAFSILTRDANVAKLGITVLRTELIAEPLYGASIVCAGVFRGAGDTFVPSLLNLLSMWGVRIVLAWLLVPQIGLQGYWLAMTIELCFRGIIFIVRLIHGQWMKKSIVL